MRWRDYEITVCSDTDYEDLIAEVTYQDRFLFVVNQESGFEHLEFEFHVETGHVKIPLAELREILVMVEQRLWDLRRIDESEP